MPMLMKVDASIKAAHYLASALAGNLSQNGTTKEAIKQLMQIFKDEAAKEVRPKNVPRQRVQTIAPSQRVNITPAKHVLEVDYEEMPTLVPPDTNVISQDNAQANNTQARHSTRSIAQELILMASEISDSNNKITAHQASQRRFPMKFHCEFAGAVMDGETDELLEYHHLIKHLE